MNNFVVFPSCFARTKGMYKHKVTNTTRQQHLRSLTHLHSTLSKCCSCEPTLCKVVSPFDWCHIWRCNRICCVRQVGAAWGPVEEESRVPISPVWSHVSPGMSSTFIRLWSSHPTLWFPSLRQISFWYLCQKQTLWLIL